MLHSEIPSMPFYSKTAPNVAVVLEFTGAVDNCSAEEKIIESLTEKYLQDFLKNPYQEGGVCCE